MNGDGTEAFFSMNGEGAEPFLLPKGKESTLSYELKSMEAEQDTLPDKACFSTNRDGAEAFFSMNGEGIEAFFSMSGEGVEASFP